jgi:ABC-type nitrate/sulfonate/bicarbonate transport system substrate-binding protein
VLRLLAAVALALALAGCAGPGEHAPRDESATLLLDFQPNAVHAGIYTALAHGYDRAEGVRLHVRQPSSSSDAVKLLAAGKVDFAILDIHDLAIARAKGSDVVGVMSIVQQPLAAVLAQRSIHSPRDLEGRRVGVTGVPSDDAVLRSIVLGAGGDPALVHTVTIGFNAVPALLSGRVAAATAFWSAEGIALRERGRPVRAFKVADYGAPSYPELVLCVARTTLQDHPELVRATVTALERGYRLTVSDPEASASDLLDAAQGLDRATVDAELDALMPAFLGATGRPGALDVPTLRRWARWEVRFGIVPKRPRVHAAFVTKYADAAA